MVFVVNFQVWNVSPLWKVGVVGGSIFDSTFSKGRKISGDSSTNILNIFVFVLFIWIGNVR